MATQEDGRSQLGPYFLIRKLGEGGMGTVYLAEDPADGRRVAIKFLPKSAAENPEFLKRFEREAEAAAKLRHPCIAAGYAAGEDRGYHYVCDGVLRRRAARSAAPPRAIPPSAARRRDSPSGDERATIRPRAGRHPSRRQAGQHLHHERREHEDPGPRPRQDGGGVRAFVPDDERRGGRDASLHLPRAGGRVENDRRPGRHLLARRDLLSSPDRTDAVRRLLARQGDVQARPRRAARSARPARRYPRQLRASSPEDDGEETGGPVRDLRRSLRRSQGDHHRRIAEVGGAPSAAIDDRAGPEDPRGPQAAVDGAARAVERRSGRRLERAGDRGGGDRDSPPLQERRRDRAPFAGGAETRP